MEFLIYALLIAALAFLGTPLFAIIGGIAIIAFEAAGYDPASVIVELYRLAGQPALIAIPLFTFAGYLLAESKAPRRMVALAQSMFGWAPGGLAIVALISCAVFTAFTGASGVTIIALGGLLYPILIQEKYSEKFTLGLMTTSGSLGLLFPPSLPLILYAMVAGNTRTAGGGTPDVSIDRLFVAGVIPGIILLLILGGYAIRQGVASHVIRIPFSFANVWKAAKDAAWEIPLPFLVVGGIYGGWFTATESAAVTAFYVFIVEVFVYRDITLFHDVPRVIKESMILVGAIFMILGCAMGLTNYLIDAEVPARLFAFIQEYVSSKALFLVLINIFLLIVGMMMDVFSAIIVVVPLIIPIAAAYDINPVHMGIIFLTNLEIGYLTPPVGLNLFISSFRFEKPVASVVRATLPYIGLLLFALILITYIPQLSLYLVELLGVK
jgi:C4-dicarboxylate transporter, DctM subunit